MKFTLFPKDCGIPRRLGRVLSWIVMIFGVGVMITGILARDVAPVGAQDNAQQAVPAEAAAQIADGAAQGAVNGVAAQNVPQAVEAASKIVDAAARDAMPDNAPQTVSQAVEAASKIVNAAARGAASGSADIVVNVDVPAGAQNAEAPAIAQNPEALAAAQIAEAPAIAQNPEDELAARYQVETTETAIGHKALIEQKKATDTTNVFSRIMSIFGIFAFIGIAWLLSNNKKKVLWKLVAVGTTMQLLFAMFILWTPVGKAIFAWLNDGVTVLLGFTNAGVNFLFASYVSGAVEPGLVNTAMSILPPIIFFSSLMTVLYHLGVMQWIVRGMAVFMMKLMGTSGSESLSAVANIFVGMTEAPLVVKPYVKNMTQSELFAIMTGGMATVAGGVMASYVAMLQPFFPDIAGHLIAASVMSAPATLVVAKLMIPETEKSETMGQSKLDKLSNDANVIDAAARGAGEGMQLAINVGAMLLAFVALIALINFVLGLPSRLVNAHTYEHVAGYVTSAGGKLDPACDNIYSSSDTIACTHGALLSLAALQNIAVPEENKVLSGDQGDQIKQTDALYGLVLGGLSNDTPVKDSAVYNDCKNDHDIAACGALIARTQQESWTPALEKKSVWPLLSLETLFGFIFFPIAFIMGVPLSDCFLVGQLLGEKMAVNEFVAYLHLSKVVDQLSYRGIVISTYALCGFANFGSIAIQIGGIGGMAPNRRSDIAKLGIKAMIGGSIAAFMTATIAGALI